MGLKRRVHLFGIAILALMFALTLPLTAFAQGHGHGRGRGPDLGKKCGKFVNCHDARDGRWDGRGPKQDGLFRNGISFRRNRRDRRFRDRNFVHHDIRDRSFVHHNYIRGRRYGRRIR
jgi:hypothetical protein